jgi:predicted sugar kinase
VAEALAEAEAAGAAGVGQSSWGPTGFAVTGTEAEARELVRRLEQASGERARLSLVIARVRNGGAEITAHEAEGATFAQS